MYRELLGEMVKCGLTREELAKQIGVSEKTLFNKLNGATDFSWTEVKAIRDIVAPDYQLETLFKCN
ncbi:MAG TPA: hypothetical protein VFC83_01660 [Erysipelotrichaceae bacterium]|nr:hypothetical protein [Erysipelotrichaceae bacterium]